MNYELSYHLAGLCDDSTIFLRFIACRMALSKLFGIITVKTRWQQQREVRPEASEAPPTQPRKAEV